MKTTHVRLKKTLTLAAAGKMALAAGSASAALGKTDNTPTDQNQLPPVSLDQIGYPLDLLTPPMGDFNASEADGALGKAGSGSFTGGAANGFIWAGELARPTSGGDSGSKDSSGDTSGDPSAQQPPAPQARIDFIVNGIRNDIPMQVFLAYSTAGGRPDAWIGSATGHLELDPAALQLIAAIHTQPNQNVADFPSTPLGHVPPRRSRSVTVPVVLSDLSDPSLAGNSIFFQAIAIPVDPDGEFLWDQSQVSELDHYRIERYESETESGSKNGDASASQSKSGGDSSTDGDSSGGK